MARAHPIPSPVDVLVLFEGAGCNVRDATALLATLLDEYPDDDGLARAVRDCEHEGDRLVHDILCALDRDRTWAVPGMDAADGHAVACALDDVVDHAEESAARLGLYAVEASLAPAAELAGTVARAGAAVADAVSAMVRHDDLGPVLQEIHRLERDGDRVHRAAVASLFADGTDPMVVIRWKDILRSLESALDACNTVANLLEGVRFRRR